MREDISRNSKKQEKEKPKAPVKSEAPKVEKPKEVADSFDEMDRMAKSAVESSPKEDKVPSEATTFEEMDKAAKPKKEHKKYNFKTEAAIPCPKCGHKVHTQSQLKLHMTRKDHG